MGSALNNSKFYDCSLEMRIFATFTFPHFMNTLESLNKSAFCEITSILDSFAQLDAIRRLDLYVKSGSKGEQPPLLPHEECLCKVRKNVMGITSAIRYMQLSILQIKKRYSANYYSAYEFTAYDFYRYHYSMFCHAIATIHDLYFKMVVELCDLDIGSKRMIQWDKLHKALKDKGEDAIILLLKQFYSVVEEHEQKRHVFSHEGLLSSKMLDNYHLTNFWSNAHRDYSVINTKPEYTEGTKENKYLLAKTKKAFLDKLNNLILNSIDYTLSLFKLLLPIFLKKMDHNFINSHKQEFIELNNECINRYILDRISY